MIPELIFLAVAIVAIIAVVVHKQKRKMEPEASAHEPVNNVDEATTFPGYVIVDGKKYEGTVKIMAVGLQVYNASGKLVLEERIAHGGHPVLRWNMDNIFIRTDPAGNIKADKAKSTEKIDGAIALIMALDRAIRCGNDSGESVYDSRGVLVI